MYGCGEAIHLACSCEKGKMHLIPDMSIVEEGPPNIDGQTPLIVTGLINHTMPFLRYQNGDSGSLTDEKCTCGLNTPLMELKVSRLSDVFTFSNGKKYPSLYFVLRLYKKGFDGVELFQFQQDKIDHIFLRIVKNNRFTILKEKKIQITKSEAEQFYKVHETKPFYNDLCAYLSSGPIVVMVLEKEDALLGNRKLMGATNPKDAEEGTIRKKYGISIDKNSVHGSDSVENAKIEIDFFFKD